MSKNKLKPQIKNFRTISVSVPGFLPYVLMYVFVCVEVLRYVLMYVFVCVEVLRYLLMYVFVCVEVLRYVLMYVFVPRNPHLKSCVVFSFGICRKKNGKKLLLLGTLFRTLYRRTLYLCLRD